jgi:hypothetical protein
MRTYTVTLVTFGSNRIFENLRGRFGDKGAALEAARMLVPGATEPVRYGWGALAYIGDKVTAIVAREHSK